MYSKTCEKSQPAIFYNFSLPGNEISQYTKSFNAETKKKNFMETIMTRTLSSSGTWRHVIWKTGILYLHEARRRNQVCLNLQYLSNKLHHVTSFNFVSLILLALYLFSFIHITWERMFISQITRQQRGMGQKLCWSAESRKNKKRGIKWINKKKKEGNKNVYC